MIDSSPNLKTVVGTNCCYVSAVTNIGTAHYYAKQRLLPTSWLSGVQVDRLFIRPFFSSTSEQSI